MFGVATLLPRHAGLCWVFATSVLVSSSLFAQEAKDQPADDGIFITVNNPITSEVFNRVKNLADAARTAKGGPLISRIIFDFNPKVRRLLVVQIVSALDQLKQRRDCTH